MVGDGLMAIFGAPLPLENRQEQAVRAAQEMIEMIDLFNFDQTAQGKTQIKIGIGIASGSVIAGYTGTLHRATYTCVGDTVNLAARLEAHTKVVGQPILIDEATRLGLSSAIGVEDQGVVQLKGKIKEVRIFSVPVNQ
jgi:class 3 adenylate cyclase